MLLLRKIRSSRRLSKPHCRLGGLISRKIVVVDKSSSMPNIIRSVDSAYPQPLHLVPRNVSVYLGYTGIPGCTHHIWTVDEIRAVEDAHLTWWAICVPPQDALGTATGIDCAEYAAEFLSRLGYDRAKPVFIDIEAESWYADRAAADATVIAWRARLREHGYAH